MYQHIPNGSCLDLWGCKPLRLEAMNDLWFLFVFSSSNVVTTSNAAFIWKEGLLHAWIQLVRFPPFLLSVRFTARLSRSLVSCSCQYLYIKSLLSPHTVDLVNLAATPSLYSSQDFTVYHLPLLHFRARVRSNHGASRSLGALKSPTRRLFRGWISPEKGRKRCCSRALIYSRPIQTKKEQRTTTMCSRLNQKCSVTPYFRYTPFAASRV